MKVYVGASLLYRLDVEAGSGVLGVIDVAATCIDVHLNGEIELIVFPPSPHKIDHVTARGWSHFGSNPDNAPPRTWRWHTALVETGGGGRPFIVEMMNKPGEWAAVLSMYVNLADFRAQYRVARTAAIARDWPELPAEPAAAPSGPDDAEEYGGGSREH